MHAKKLPLGWKVTVSWKLVRSIHCATGFQVLFLGLTSDSWGLLCGSELTLLCSIAGQAIWPLKALEAKHERARVSLVLLWKLLNFMWVLAVPSPCSAVEEMITNLSKLAQISAINVVNLFFYKNPNFIKDTFLQSKIYFRDFNP